MTPDAPAPDGQPDEQSDDVGEPIVELQDLSLEVSNRFVGRVRGKIERRVVAGELLNLLWTAPVLMLFEFISIPFEAFSKDRRS